VTEPTEPDGLCARYAAAITEIRLLMARARAEHQAHDIAPVVFVDELADALGDLE
jgi:hypothetical protein